MNWDSEIETIKLLVFEENLSYETIGKLYNCSGSNIRKILKQRGITLPVRSKNHGNIPINKGIKKKKTCLNCFKELASTSYKYCSVKCLHEYIYNQWVVEYKKDNAIAKLTKWGQIPAPLRRYIFQKYNNKCCICGWNKINPFTQTLPLEIDHINGNSEDNSENNLRLLCPNCHSLTPTYRGANRGHGRNITWITKNNKSAQEETLDVEAI